MKCKNPKCDNELTGRSQTCSVKCRVALHRTVTNQSVTEGSVTPKVLTTTEQYETLCLQNRKVSLEHYQSNPELYAQRTNPEKLNWGPYMTVEQLAVSGCKANRVSIPGDWDYGK